MEASTVGSGVSMAKVAVKDLIKAINLVKTTNRTVLVNKDIKYSWVAYMQMQNKVIRAIIELETRTINRLSVDGDTVGHG